MGAAVARLVLTAALLPLVAGCGFGGGNPAVAGTTPDWSNTDVRVVSKIDVHAGIVAFTSLDGAQRLRTVVLDKTTGAQLWSRSATMAGRPAHLGVGPPAIVSRASQGAIVVAIEPGGNGGRTALVARDARTGKLRWRTAVRTSYGPQRCGSYVCVSDDHNLYMRDPGNGEIMWHARGPATVATSSSGSAVLFHWGGRPAIQKRDLDTGKVLWEVAVGRILGPGVDTDGGWTLSRVSGVLVGHVGPSGDRGNGQQSPFGFFGLRISDGALLWRHERLLAVHPSTHPKSILVGRKVTQQGMRGGYVVVAPRTGRLTGKAPPSERPDRQTAIALSTDLERLGWYRPGRPARAFALDSGLPASPGDSRMWSFCEQRSDPPTVGANGDYRPITPLCPVDLSTGQKSTPTDTVPPEWYTGRVAGWRIWPGPRGGLYGQDAGFGDSPGMYVVSDR